MQAGAKWSFALTSAGERMGSAMELPQQVRSQVQLGNEGKIPSGF